jgi:hypothetical protein
MIYLMCVAEPKVDNFNYETPLGLSDLGEQQVLGLQVPVRYIATVQGLHAIDNLVKKFTRLNFLDVSVSHDVVEHFSPA